MGFVKVVKNKAYFKRFQVKFRRRREAKTDYYARTRLIIQDKNKYKTPKYRLVFRKTNRDLIAQIVAADYDHDTVVESAYSHELVKYGVKVGLTNYAAAYATGLLLARRVNAKFGLEYKGLEKADGSDNPNYFAETESLEKNAFKAVLDVGLQRTTTGARIWGALKGAFDGGLNIPHTDKRFPGSKGQEKKDGAKHEADPEVHRKYIYGLHVAEYMNKLKNGYTNGDGEEVEGDEAAYAKHFSRYVKAGVNAENIEATYARAHAAIRASPARARTATQKGYFATRATPKAANATYPKKRWNRAPINVASKKDRIKQKLTKAGIASAPKLILKR